MSRQAAVMLIRCRMSLALMVLATALLGAQAPARAQTEATSSLRLWWTPLAASTATVSSCRSAAMWRRYATPAFLPQ